MCSIIGVSVTDVDAKSNRSNAPATHENEKKKKHLEAASSNVGVFSLLWCPPMVRSAKKLIEETFYFAC
jgi:hypothetical protein